MHYLIGVLLILISGSSFGTVEPAVTVVLAGMVLGETISFFRIIGGMMIILAVIILARSEAPGNEPTKRTNG
jgi:drug/metabolite transporter (DMT)-like permease